MSHDAKGFYTHTHTHTHTCNNIIKHTHTQLHGCRSPVRNTFLRCNTNVHLFIALIRNRIDSEHVLLVIFYTIFILILIQHKRPCAHRRSARFRCRDSHDNSLSVSRL